jgi:hypothetical protein
VSFFKKADLPGIIVDDSEAQLEGFDTEASTMSGFIVQGYRHDGNERKGQQSAQFTPTLPAAGNYRIAIAYIPQANRATNVPVTIHHAGGSQTILVNQRQKPEEKGILQPLGTFRLEPGSNHRVEITNQDTNGYVILDAIQFLPVP